VPGSGVRAGEQGVGAVDLVAGGAEVLPDRAEVGAAGDAVLHQPGGLGLVGVGGGAGVDAQLGFQRVGDGSGADEADQAAGETGDCGRAARQIASRRAVVTWSTALPRASAAAMPSLISRSYSARSGSWLSSMPGPGRVRPGLRDGAWPPDRRRDQAGRLELGRLLLYAPWRWCRAAIGVGVGHRVWVLGGDAEELLQVLEGDQPTPAYLDVGQVAAAHLVVEQVADRPVSRAASSTE